ncbi:MAG: arsenite methyltransferase [Perlabentimonas sp.]
MMDAEAATDSNRLKQIVKEKYSGIALKNQKSGCCNSSGCCNESGFSMIGDEYQNIEGYNTDADLGLGCGIPTEYANIQKGDSALDLGSGAGNDCFVARSIVGNTGKVVGLDFSEEMLARANQNTNKLGYSNVSFIKGDIENMPLDDNQFDVVISNCVLNLVPDKKKAFSEIMRVLKSGGHFCVSDVVVKGNLPEGLRTDAEMYAGCVSGALQVEEYLEAIKRSGFANITVHKQRKIEIPENILRNYFNESELASIASGDKGIFSITVSGTKKS